MKTVCVIGLGYIGLPTSAMLASKGIKVIGVDVNENVVKTINQGKIHIVEPELENIVEKATKEGYFYANLEPVEADVYIIAVPTPFTDHKKPDLKYVEEAASSIAKVVKQGNLVILESTSPVGTTERVANVIFSKRPELNLDNLNLAFCPERVLPGKIIHELTNNNRIIGGLSQSATEKAKELYQIFVKGEIVLTDARTAELAKLTENAFRDVNIAFANELSLICEKLNIDVWNLIELANKHPRVNILQPGPGVGGHCIAVDPWFIVDSNPNEARLIRSAREINDSRPAWVVNHVTQMCQTTNCSKLAFWGLAYKNDIDDLRESPAVEIVKEFADSNKQVECLVVEPNIKDLPAMLMSPNIRLCTVQDALIESSIIVILVNHKEFYFINPEDYPKISFMDFKGILERKSNVNK